MNKKEEKNISRRDALRYMGVGALGLAVASSGIEALASDRTGGVPVFGRVHGGEGDGGCMVDRRKDPLTGVENSLLGFGCMRLPTTSEGKIDTVQAEKMIDYAYAHGVNYYDTAWVYHNGESESFIGNALKKYPRDTYHLTTKLPIFMLHGIDDAKTTFQAQLDKCQVDYFDYFLLHSVSDEEAFNKVCIEGGVLDYMYKEKAAGRVRRLGFSFHGSVEFLKKLLDNYPWDVVQIQCNYLDWKGDERAKEKYDMITAKGIPVIVMEPIRGGALANPNPDAREILTEMNPDLTPAAWALRFVASQPNVMTVLSGMSIMQHVQENVCTMSNVKPLTAAETAGLMQAAQYIRSAPTVGCTACRYCMPCPFGVDIPGNFKIYNDLVNNKQIPYLEDKGSADFEVRKKAFLDAFAKMNPETTFEHCRHCGKCVRKCPQHIRIPDQFKRIKALSDGVGSTKLGFVCHSVPCSPLCLG